MRYWWVNQNRTYKDEINGGYMWSPKRKKDGSKNHFYENMIRVKPGDLLFSFYKSHIPYVGIITSQGYSQPKPQGDADWQAWDEDGWMVNVDYVELEKRISPKKHIEDLAPLLPKKYAPFQANGNGLQGVYLTELPVSLAHKILELIGAESTAILSRSGIFSGVTLQDIEAASSRIESTIRKSRDIPETEKETIILARKGQGRFRDDVLRMHKKCPFTGISDPEHLRASHIRPWAKCLTNQERVDPLNGLALSPAADHLFDKGYLTFNDSGEAMFSNKLTVDLMNQLGFWPDKETYKIPIHDERQLSYLSFHRKNIFKKQGF